MGIVIHYIFKWSRKVFTLACIPFDDHHTTENIYSRLESTLLDWNIMDKVCVCLRDNAANMKAAFNVPSCPLSSAPCLNDALQLVIKEELLSMKSVKSLIQLCRKLCRHGSRSNLFYSELYLQQEKQMTSLNRVGLFEDVETRWNSTYYMLERILFLKQAIAATLLEFPLLDVDFNNNDWLHCENVVQVLSSFEQATKLLSFKEACISSTIPFVTTIMRSLDITQMIQE